jgi:hypothetical protein
MTCEENLLARFSLVTMLPDVYPEVFQSEHICFKYGAAFDSDEQLANKAVEIKVQVIRKIPEFNSLDFFIISYLNS